MKKVVSILITTPRKVLSFHFSIFSIKLILFIIFLILCGIFWLVFEYSSIGYKNIKIKLLERENKKLREENNKILSIKRDLYEQREKIIKIANMLGVDNPFEKHPVELTVNFKPFTEKREEKIIMPVEGYITRNFSLSHTGIDIAASYGAPVKSVTSGIVSFSGIDSVLGYTIKIENEDMVMIYGHLSKMMVKEGEKVREGELIGFVGSSGKSDAPHLHFEVRIKGVAVNPLDYITFK